MGPLGGRAAAPGGLLPGLRQAAGLPQGPQQVSAERPARPSRPGPRPAPRRPDAARRCRGRCRQIGALLPLDGGLGPVDLAQGGQQQLVPGAPSPGPQLAGAQGLAQPTQPGGAGAAQPGGEQVQGARPGLLLPVGEDPQGVQKGRTAGSSRSGVSATGTVAAMPSASRCRWIRAREEPLRTITAISSSPRPPSTCSSRISWDSSRSSSCSEPTSSTSGAPSPCPSTRLRWCTALSGATSSGCPSVDSAGWAGVRWVRAPATTGIRWAIRSKAGTRPAGIRWLVERLTLRRPSRAGRRRSRPVSSSGRAPRKPWTTVSGQAVSTSSAGSASPAGYRAPSSRTTAGLASCRSSARIRRRRVCSCFTNSGWVSRKAAASWIRAEGS
ncbi:Uncharacterised protein [Rothia kristinae]|nr:Uncharacterised protein [Rothia kristinae]